MTKFLLPAIALAAILGAGGWWYSTQSASAQGSGADTTAAADTGSADGAEIHPLDKPLGNPDAPVTVIEYSSFTCPHCKRFNEGPYERLKENYIEPGRILWLKREVYFDRYGRWAGMVARCGSGDRYHGLAELIYERQSDWTRADDPARVAANLRQLGRQAGLSDDQLNACLEDSDKALALTEFYQDNAETHGVRATPTFVINGQTYQNMSYDEFASLLDEELDG